MKQLSKAKSYNTRNAYFYHIKKYGGDLTFKQFKDIVSAYYEALFDYAYTTGDKVNLPCMGVAIAITSYKPKIKISENGERILQAKTDWKASHKYWNEHPDEPRKVIKFVNMHTAMQIYRWNVYRQKCAISRYALYNTKFIGNGSSIINKKINSGIFPIKINPKYEIRYNKKNI